ncbi:MAG TPA: YfiR family protein [Methylibium sp.]|uniref:YfiR family protein n=1 Tax=Methylibium sp. TaxID=2067992 RepID=UPI002DB6CF74|nr:YfiR family protein [Methylibium sp.]HEU4460849.1 YfiR family protein [Methylibium sp.]
MSGRSSASLLIGRRVLLALLTSLQCAAMAQTPAPAMPTEAAVKAAFLFKFPGFVDGPAGPLLRPGQPVVIGVVGSEEVAFQLDQINRARSEGGNAVVLRRLRDGEAASDLHVLFIGAGRESRVRESAAAVRHAVLIVTEQENGLRLGGILNFVVEGGRVRFTASMPAAEARGLRLSARLLAVAQAVETGR